MEELWQKGRQMLAQVGRIWSNLWRNWRNIWTSFSVWYTVSLHEWIVDLIEYATFSMHPSLTYTINEISLTLHPAVTRNFRQLPVTTQVAKNLRSRWQVHQKQQEKTDQLLTQIQQSLFVALKELGRKLHRRVTGILSLKRFLGRSRRQKQTRACLKKVCKNMKH